MIDQLHARVTQHAIKGFLADDEAAHLYHLAQAVAPLGPCLEIGSYCGKSTVYLGSACQSCGMTVYAVDHHRGSEEHQVGEEYHDPELFDAANQCMDSFTRFRKTLDIFELADTVVPVVASSALAARHWATPLSMVFVDGGHSHAMSRQDCLDWSRHILPGGVLAIHDIFPNPEDGGQGPYLALQAVLESGKFEWEETINSLGVLRKK